VQQALDAYVLLITALHPDIEEVVFDSLASGTPVPGSDVDVLLVLGEADRPVFRSTSMSSRTRTTKSSG
jgi:predicted nucleotidyltransferase